MLLLMISPIRIAILSKSDRKSWKITMSTIPIAIFLNLFQKGICDGNCGTHDSVRNTRNSNCANCKSGKKMWDTQQKLWSPWFWSVYLRSRSWDFENWKQNRGICDDIVVPTIPIAMSAIQITIFVNVMEKKTSEWVNEWVNECVFTFTFDIWLVEMCPRVHTMAGGAWAFVLVAHVGLGGKKTEFWI